MTQRCTNLHALLASAFVLAPTGALLLVHHVKLGRWLQPGGHIEPVEA